MQFTSVFSVSRSVSAFKEEDTHGIKIILFFFPHIFPCFFIFKKGKNCGAASADKGGAAIGTELLKKHLQKGEFYEKCLLQIVA